MDDDVRSAAVQVLSTLVDQLDTSEVDIAISLIWSILPGLEDDLAASSGPVIALLGL